MIAREWKTRCSLHQKENFIEYLYQTGVKDICETAGFNGVQILTREIGEFIEITLISYWESLDSIKSFAGDNISVAKSYPEDSKYELESDKFVTHYEVEENQWLLSQSK